MKANELIKDARMGVIHGWRGSRIPPEYEPMLEAIAAHYEICAECRCAFDDTEYEEQTLHDLVIKRFPGTHIEDWVCGSIPTYHASPRDIY